MPPMKPGTGLHGPLLLEEPLIRTPYELLRRSHRSAQRQVEKDFVNVQTQLSQLLKQLTGDEEKDKALALSKLDTASERIRGLKRKLDDLQPHPGPGSQSSVIRERIRYVEDVLLDARLKKPDDARNKPADVSYRATRGEEEDGKDSKERERKEREEGIAAPVPEKAKRVSFMDTDMERRDSIASELEKISGNTTPATPAKPMDGDRSLDRYIIDHLLRTGRMKTARTLAASLGIEELVDLKLFSELCRIEAALVERNSVVEALAWCGENRGTLKKMESNLEFTLRLQEFIELCRRRETESAIAYARKNLAPWASTHLAEFCQAMTLLAFGPKTGVPAYRKLFDSSRWETVRTEFRRTFLSVYALPTQSLLALALSAGLSSLRLPACQAQSAPAPASPVAPREPLPPVHPILPPVPGFSAFLGMESLPELERPPSPEEEEEKSPVDDSGAPANVDCPTCADDVRVLARELPFAHHVNSTLVCRISGDVMDSDNVPLAFPNGCVYSSKALAEMAKNNFDVCICPRTHETCGFSKLRKVYIS